MEINEKLAKGLKIENNDYEFVIANKKKDVETDILCEIWFKKK